MDASVYLLGLCVVACAFALRRVIAGTGGPRTVVAHLLGALAFAVAGFGLVYHMQYSNDPTSFVFSESIASGRSSELLSEAEEHHLETWRKMVTLGSLGNSDELDAISAALRDSGCYRTRDQFSITTIRCAVADPASASRYWSNFEISEKGYPSSYTYVYRGNALGGPLERAYVHLAKSALSTRPGAFSDGIDRAVKALRAEEERLEELVDSMPASVPRWGAVDFMYFSAVTITTLGYGDIVPNTRAVRVVVMLEAMTGVFFAAYALLLVKRSA